MKKLLLFLALHNGLNSYSQNDFNSQIQKIADTLAKKIVQTGSKKVAVVEFINLDESHTRLGEFLSDELSSELSNLTDNLTKFEVVERSNIDIIFKEKRLIQSNDGNKLAKDLGRLDVADLLIWAIISDFEGYYRVNIKLLNTKSGNAMSAFKSQFIKTPALENFNKEIVRKADASEPVRFTAPQKNNDGGGALTSTPADPCSKKTGSLKITNLTDVDVWGLTKIAVRIPKYEGAKPYDEYAFYTIILEKNETKELANLPEGFSEYVAKKYNSGTGWCGSCGNVSSGQVQINRCNITELVIR